MLLTITTTHRPATELGYLLHKHPGRCQSFEMGFGQAHVFYPEANEDRCTAALLMDIDPVGLVRRERRADFALYDYVNDRPYVASSFLSTTIAQVYGSALNGHCKTHPQLAEAPIALEARLAAVPSPNGEETLRRLFEPLGYAVEMEGCLLDEQFPEWGQSRFYRLGLSGTVRLADLLTHLYVLIPVLDAGKHYFIGRDEVDKLLERGEGWLADHPEREWITRRYLMRRQVLVREALGRLSESAPDEDERAERQDREEEEMVEQPLSLQEQRLAAVVEALKVGGAARVLDLGCGEGQLIGQLLADQQFAEVVGVDVSHVQLQKAARRLKLERMPPMKRQRVRLMQGALTYRDDRLSGYDAAALVEVIEHLDAPRLAALERAVFEFARPGCVVITTPNAEYNVRFETLPAGKLRHRDHRFEWTRAEFRAWGERVGEKYGYQTAFATIGPDDPEVGSPTQMGIFSHAGE
ncbi:MAG: 3' terminal RNA ribose 2'-O-methyltransferase Hen1 [Anaerolineae bacterium]|nr:3' terminal RNA ribose 2'-O-methyltransferase Hen1 [Anaerolineae bacterium]